MKPATTTIMNNKVLLALSGGVDSSVALSILQKQGYEVEALCIKMSDKHNKTVAAAEKAAAHLSVKLHIVSAEELFSSVVIKNFAEKYLSGKTPNPCIICNPLVKFRVLYDFAMKHGFNKIATGHYAKISELGGKKYISPAKNLQKDQSYMLYRLPEEIINHLLFPLGDIEDKNAIRNMATDENMPSANSPDSQEICFIENENYADFIERNFGRCKRGLFVGPKGENLGKNKGIINYTIGQRKGLGIAYSEPIFVKKIDAESGNVFLCRSGEEFFSKVILEDVFLPHPLENNNFSADVKIRYSAKTAKADISVSENTATVVFTTPQRACCPGQSVVFYKDGVVLGGGFIKESV